MNLKDFDKIYVFVSGGIDSTYLYDKLKRFYKDNKIFYNKNSIWNKIKQKESINIT